MDHTAGPVARTHRARRRLNVTFEVTRTVQQLLHPADTRSAGPGRVAAPARSAGGGGAAWCLA
jgi:hypothetical protein